jgi:hypothetical protein
LAGAPLASWVGWVEVPSASSTAEIFGVSSSTTALASATAWSIGCAWLTNDLAIRANGATPATDFRTLTLSALRTTYSGQRIWLEVRITAGTSAPVVRVNGAAIAGTYTDGAGTDPDWLSASLVATFHETGYLWPAGVAPLGCWLNAHLTDAESESWRTTGRPPVWVVAGGSMVATYTSDFATSLGSFGPVSATLNYNVDGIDGRDDCMEVINGGVMSYAGTSVLLTVGAGYQFTFEVYIPATNATAASMFLWFGGATQYHVTTVGAWVSVVATLTVDAGGFIRLRFPAATVGDKFYIRNFVVLRAGALSLPGVQPILALDDITDIGGNPARLVGMNPVSADRRWRISADTTTNGNQRLLGGPLMSISELSFNGHVIDSIEQYVASGTPTTTIGEASGSPLYKSSSVLSSGLNSITPALRRLYATSFWIGSNSTAAVRTTITGHRAI